MKDDPPKTPKSEPMDGKEDAPEEEVSFFNKMRSDGFRQKLEGMLKDGVIKNIAREMKLPREIVTHLMSQIDETKQATLKLVSREIRLFLENTNLSEEMAKLLSQLSFEVSTKVRFVRNDPPSSDTASKQRNRRHVKKTEVKTAEGEAKDVEKRVPGGSETEGADASDGEKGDRAG